MFSAGLNLASIVVSGNERLPITSRIAFARGLAALRRREKVAREIAHDLREERGESGAGFAIEAEAHRRAERIDAAVAAANEAARRSPESGTVQRIAGMVSLASGDFSTAAQRLAIATRRRPRDAAVHHALARALLMSGGDALPHAARAVELSPGQASYVKLLGSVLRRSADTERALELLDRSLRSPSASRAVVESMVSAFLDTDRQDDAIALIRKRVSPEDQPRLLAKAFLNLRRYEEAVTHADRAIEIDPRNPWNHYLRSNALQGMGNLSAALASLQDARARGDDSRFERRERHLSGLMRTLTGDWIPTVPGIPETLQPAAPDRVLHLLERTLPHRQSGYTVRSMYTVTAQRDAGLDPIVVTRLGFPKIDGVHEYEPLETVGGVPHYRLELPDIVNYAELPKDEYLERYAAEAAKVVQRVRPAMLQPASSYFNAMVGLALKRRFNIPMVYEVRGFQEDSWASRRDDALGTEFYEGRLRAETLCMQGADRIVTLAEVMKEEIAGRGIDPDRIWIIPNAVDVEHFTPRARNDALARDLGLPGDRTVLGYISSLSGYEGVDTLLRGIAVLLQRGVAVSGLVVGDGPELEPLRRLAGELGITEHVRITGRVPHDQILEYYSLIDVFVVPRKNLRVCRLVTPLKPFEAMAMQRALLVSNVTALEEIAAPGERGLSFVAEDPESLAAQAEVFVRDPELRNQMGAAARDWVTRERTWTRNAERYRDLYENLLSERGLRLSAPRSPVSPSEVSG